MAILLSSRRIAWLGVFLVALGVLEYLIVVTIHSKQEDNLPAELLLGKTVGRSSLRFHHTQSESRIKQKEFQILKEALNIEAHGELPERVPHKQHLQVEQQQQQQQQHVVSEVDIKKEQPSPPLMQLSKQSRADSQNQFSKHDFEVKKTQDGPKIVRKPPPDYGPEVLVENSTQLTPRSLTDFETNGGDILFTLRTTGKYHDKRLPLLFETWMTKVNHSTIFMVTDRWDQKWMEFSKTQGAVQSIPCVCVCVCV